ncbi:hypothetical protein AXK12_04180 [Cephaloticoccus capnophilus]|uniref:TonB-dependent receptor plug domain-containing protein n=1 Tax=Cephaloticoccus capnophilus TaxID=1548208 RepID=A0A139SN97_9BACT|nr:TonB-dependent receptor plug domain-containing protein [Cephaloticoccus capnophilus]KXU36029.1 hypothetical protein AXK12_04180 [Cephaloticoccus capnophilus]
MTTLLFRVRGARLACAAIAACALLFSARLTSPASAQALPPERAAAAHAADDELFILTPFEVSTGNETTGYTAATTLAGNRLNTQLRDVGSAVTVVTEELLRDIGATDNRSLLQYTVGTEVGGLRGNFAGLGDGSALSEDLLAQNSNTRVRGLSAADNTRDYFRSSIPWDAYNIDRVELQRGANSILFGQGSPGGIINTGLKSAQFRNFGEAAFTVGSHGTTRSTLDVNRVLLPKELALRVSLLHGDERYRQKPAFSEDSRVYAALRYEPRALNRGGVRTTIKANFESGRIRSNAPRMLPPTDGLTPWFTELGQRTYDQFQAFDHLSGRPVSGQWRRNLFTTGGPNPDYEPWAAIFTAGNGTTVFSPGNGAQDRWVTAITGAFLRGGLDASGALDGQFASIPDNGLITITPTGQWAINANAPYAAAGVWKNNVLTDTSVFDFHNRLIDGDTKRERQKFGVGNLSLSQTYFDNRIGLSIDLSKESYDSEKRATLPGEVVLQIDPIRVFGDGSPDTGLIPGQRPYADGTPNPNLGRVFTATNNTQGNRRSETEQTAARATAFAQHDFSDKGRAASWWARALGQHTLTGLVGRERAKSDAREWQRYGLFDNDYYALSGRAGNRFDTFAPLQILYLGDSLLGRDLAGASLPTLGNGNVLTSGPIRYFDSTWNAVGVNPGDPWLNGFYLDPSAQRSTQSENPANYVGWTTTQLNIVDADQSAANRARLTRRATLDKSTVESRALVWQGKWLDNALISTIGWRRDIAKAWSFDMTPSDFPVLPNRGQLDFGNYRLGNDASRIAVESKSYSFVAHLNDLPGLRDALAWLPVNVSLFHNRSQNFKPDASRVGIYGEPLPAPAGKTEDRGLRIETKDGRYSLRVTRYRTSNSNASSAQINAASIGQWMAFTQNFANVFEYNIKPWAFDATAPGATGSDTDIYDSATGDESAMRYNFHFFANRPLEPGEFLSGDGKWIVSPAREKAVVDATRAFQRSVDPRFWQAWRINTFGDFGPPDGQTPYSVPAGFSITEDNISEGWEIELSAQPTKNWRVMLNASQTEARRVNVGNANMRELMGLINDALKIPNGVARMHHYYGTEDVVTAGKNWFDGEGLSGAPGSEWRRAQLYENTTVPELREWRVNVITNYEFDKTALKGVNIGGGVRYQSSIALGYPPTGDPNDPLKIEYDFSRPYKGPAETNLDLWIGYSRQLTRKLHWKVQLNLKDAFERPGLVPITYNPNGRPAAYRITTGQSWSLINTLSF